MFYTSMTFTFYLASVVTLLSSLKGSVFSSIATRAIFALAGVCKMLKGREYLLDMIRYFCGVYLALFCEHMLKSL
jgi:hypothetical protein